MRVNQILSPILSPINAVKRAGTVWMLAGAGAIVVAIVAAAAWLAIVWLRPGQSASAPIQATFTQLTSAAGIETDPSLSPDGKWIVYGAPGPGGDTDIFLQSVGGGSGQAPFNLTKDQPGQPAADAQPAFSPDGESIAFQSARGGGGIFVMDRMGGGVKRLTDRGFQPAWTPDVRYVVFGAAPFSDPEDRGSPSEGWKVEVATGKMTRITAGDFMQPAVSPNGVRIAYWGLPVTSTAPLEFAGNNRDLWTIRLDGSDPVRVTDDAATDWSPAFPGDACHGDGPTPDPLFKKHFTSVSSVRFAAAGGLRG